MVKHTLNQMVKRMVKRTQNKKNKIKEKKENKKNKESGFALSGNLPDGYTEHPASGEIYTVIDGEMYNLDGQKLNSAGFLDIENL